MRIVTPVCPEGPPGPAPGGWDELVWVPAWYVSPWFDRLDVFRALLWPRKCSRSSFSRRPDDAYPSRRSESAARPQRRLGRPPLPPGRAHESCRWYCGRESYSPTLFIIQLCTSRSSPAPRRRVLESHFEQMRGIEPGATRTDL